MEPDQFFLLTTPRPDSDEPSRYFRFVEVDLGTEPIESSRYDRSSFIKKVLSYLEFYRSGQYQQLYGGTKGMVILTVTTTERRLASLLKATEQAGGQSRFWFSTFDRIRTADILCDPVWSLITRAERSSLVW